MFVWGWGWCIFLKVCRVISVLQNTSWQSCWGKGFPLLELPSKVVAVDRESLKHWLRRLHCFRSGHTGPNLSAGRNFRHTLTEFLLLFYTCRNWGPKGQSDRSTTTKQLHRTGRERNRSPHAHFVPATCTTNNASDFPSQILFSSHTKVKVSFSRLAAGWPTVTAPGLPSHPHDELPGQVELGWGGEAVSFFSSEFIFGG